MKATIKINNQVAYPEFWWMITIMSMEVLWQYPT